MRPCVQDDQHQCCAISVWLNDRMHSKQSRVPGSDAQEKLHLVTKLYGL